MLKGEAWFILTGHPSGLTRDILTSERGLFDLVLKLEEMDQQTTYRMLVNYLNSLETLVQLDLMRRLPTERAALYEPTPMLLGKPRRGEPSD